MLVPKFGESLPPDTPAKPSSPIERKRHRALVGRLFLAAVLQEDMWPTIVSIPGLRQNLEGAIAVAEEMSKDSTL